MASARVLVTGASGFIGGHLVRKLVQTGRSVWALTRNAASTERVRQSGGQAVTGDVTDLPSLERAMADSRPDVVFHAAGLVRAPSPEAFHATNAIGSQNVAQACAQQPTAPVLVLVSSLAAAGPAVAGVPRVEDDTPQPVSAYGRSKLAAERAVASFAKTAPVSIVRPGIVYGPGDRALLEMLKPIALWGLHLVPGRQGTTNRLSLVYADDLVDALLRIAESGERMESGSTSAGKGTHFVSGTEQPTYTELGQIMSSALSGAEPRRGVRTLGVPEVFLRLAGKAGDVMYLLRRMSSMSGRHTEPGWINSDKMTEALAGSWVCSSTKIRTQLTWQPSKSLTEHLTETVRWYRQTGWL
jgi:nucleoside-diphosphate-sugar epimerase